MSRKLSSKRLKNTKRMTQAEFDYVKGLLKKSKKSNLAVARFVHRSPSTILRIKKSGSFKEYMEVIKLDYSADYKMKHTAQTNVNPAVKVKKEEKPQERPIEATATVIFPGLLKNMFACTNMINKQLKSINFSLIMVQIHLLIVIALLLMLLYF